MASRTAKIKLETTADTSGAKQAAAAMQGVETSAEEAEQAMRAFHERIKQAAREMNGASSAASAAETSFEDFVRATTRAESAATASGNATKQAASATKGIAQAAGQAGFQIQDFAVQVGAGTSALTAFAQQAPQLLGIFGPGGALAGALVAVGAVATKIFLDIGQGAEDAKEQANEMVDVLQNVAKAQADIMSEDFDAGANAIRISTEQAELLRQALVRVKNADAEYSRDAIANAEALRKAAEQLAILQGKQVDASKSQQEADKAAAALRAADAQAQIDKQNQLLEAANAQVKAETDRLNQAKAAAEAKQQELATTWQQLEALRQQRDELEKQAKIGPARAFPVFDAAGAQAMQAERARAAQGEQARAALADPRGITAKITLLESTVSALEKYVGSQGKAEQALSQAANDLNAAQINFEATQVETQNAIQNILRTFETQEAQIGVQQLAAASEQQYKDILTILETVKPTTEAQVRNMDVLRKAAEDGRIAANEQSGVTASLSALMSSLSADQAENRKLIQDMINKSNLNTKMLQELGRQVETLKAIKTTRLGQN